MKRLAVASAVALIALACSSSGTPQPTGIRAKIEDPIVNIDQLRGPAEENYPAGPIEVQYRISIANKSDYPMTLTRVTIRSVNPAGGAYSLQPRAYYFKESIPPHTDGAVTLNAKGYFFGRSPRESEPVTVQGTAYFNTPVGYFDKVFVREISQYGD